MKRDLFRTVLGAFVLALLMAAPGAQAATGGRHSPRAPQRRHWVPEFDPSAAGAIAALVAGGGILVARRRRR